MAWISKLLNSGRSQLHRFQNEQRRWSPRSERATERADRLRNQQLVALLEATPDFVAVATVDGTVVWRNRALADWLGDPSEGFKLQELASTTDDSSIVRGIAVATERGTWFGQGLIERGSERRDVSLVFVAHRDATGHVSHVSALIRDSSRLQTRELERLRRVNEELSEFAYAAAHDLQEPLRKLSSFCRLLEEEAKDTLSARSKKYIGYAVSGADRLQHLISDLLEYSLVGAASGALETVSLQACAEHALEWLSSAITESAAQVELAALPPVRGQNILLRRVFVNLIGNAIKYRAPQRHPEVCISAERNGQTVRVRVRDNGIGVAKEHHERVFQAFQRLHARSEYPGAGIGLAIVKRAVERCGGSIWMESEPGQGTSMYFTLEAASISPAHES